MGVVALCIQPKDRAVRWNAVCDVAIVSHLPDNRLSAYLRNSVCLQRIHDHGARYCHSPAPPSFCCATCRIAVGTGFSDRQTAAAGAIALGIFALTTLRYWRTWFLFGVGFVGVVAIEFAWYFSRTGDLLHRFHVDTTGHRTPSAQLEGGTFDGSPFFNTELMSRWKPAGIFDIHWIINPYIDLFTSPSYGPLALLTIPGAWLMLSRRAGAPENERRLGRILLVLAVFWFVTTVYVLSLRAQPRYFGPLAVVMVVFAAYALAWLSSSGQRLLALALCGLIIFANFALVGLRAPPLQVEHELVELAGSVDEELWVPPYLFEKSVFLLQIEPGTFLVHAGPAPDGALEVRVESGGTAQPVSPTAELLSLLPFPEHLRAQLFREGKTLSLWRDGNRVLSPRLQ